MVNMFNRILKNKRIVFSALLFFILSGAIIPNTTLAFVDNYSRFHPCSVIHPFDCAVYAIAAFGDVIIDVAQYISGFFVNILNYVLSQLIQDPNNKWAITRTTSIPGAAFNAGWLISKGWANMLIVLGFLGIAVAFILNLEQYKKNLIPLLIVALLVNFSVLFVGLIIDISNILMKQFLTLGEGGYSIIYKINGIFNNTLYLYPVSSWEGAGIYLGISIVFAMIYFSVGISLFLMAIIFIERYVMLAILFIFSPLAFVAYAFPLAKAKELFKKWWDNFIKWCFIGLIGAIFLNLALGILKAFGNAFQVAEQSDPNIILSYLAQIFFYLLIVIIFLLYGIKITFKASGAMSAIAIGAALATGTALLAGGAKLAGSAGKAVLPERAWNRTKEGVSGALERVGLFRPVGSTAAMKQKRSELKPEEKQRIENMTSKELTDLANGKSPGVLLPTESARRLKAAAIAKSSEKGLLKNLPQNEQEKLANYAISVDKNYAEKITKGNPGLAHLDSDKIEELRMRNAQKSGETFTDYTERIKNMSHTKAYANYKAPEIADLNNEDLIKLADQETADGTKALEEAIKRNILDQVKGGDVAKIANRLDKAKTTFGSDAKIGATKLDPRLVGYDTEAADKRAKEKGITPLKAREQLMNEANARQSASDIKNMSLDKYSNTDLMDLLKNTTANRLKEAGKDLAPEKKQALKRMLGKGGELKKAIDAALIAGNDAKVVELSDIYRTIKKDL